MTVNLGNGIFNPNIDPLVARSNPLTYKMTPKYADPYATDVDRRMAKFIISQELYNAIKDKIPAAASDKELSKFISSGDAQTPTRGYFDFFLQSVEEVFDEKFQIVETLGDSYAVFGIGKKPKIFNYSGMLLNTMENDWRINFIRVFEDYIGVSSLSKFKSSNKNAVRQNTVTLTYDSIIADGAILRLRTSMQGGNELATPFAFTMLVTKFNTTSFNNLGFSKTSIEADVAPISPDTSVAAVVNPEDQNTNQFSAIKKKV